MYYYGARYYAGWTCRFVSIGPLAGSYPYLNPYNYAGNKPINAIDIDGMQSSKDDPEVNDEGYGISEGPDGTTLFHRQYGEEIKTDQIDSYGWVPKRGTGGQLLGGSDTLQNELDSYLGESSVEVASSSGYISTSKNLPSKTNYPKTMTTTPVASLEPKNKQKTSIPAGSSITIDDIQSYAEWGGWIPVIGDAVDGVNAVVYLARGKYEEAGWSAIAIIPVLGSIISKGRKGVKKGWKWVMKIFSPKNRVDELAEKIVTLSKGAEGVTEAAKSSTATARALGVAGENAVGIGSKVRIPSLSGTAKYRIPDGLTSTTLTEVKNVAHQSLTRQLRDFHMFSQQTGRQFILYARPTTTFSRPLQNLTNQGQIIVKPIPGL